MHNSSPRTPTHPPSLARLQISHQLWPIPAPKAKLRITDATLPTRILEANAQVILPRITIRFHTRTRRVARRGLRRPGTNPTRLAVLVLGRDRSSGENRRLHPIHKRKNLRFPLMRDLLNLRPSKARIIRAGEPISPEQMQYLFMRFDHSPLYCPFHYAVNVAY